MPHYLDHNATSPPHPDVVDAVCAAMRDDFANASSIHAPGRGAARHLEDARAELAGWTRTRAADWILTGGATESIHAAILGVRRARPGTVVSSAGEHSATLGILGQIEAEGGSVVRVGLDPQGRWSADEVLEEIGRIEGSGGRVSLVSLLWASNETGAVSDVAAVAHALRGRRIPLHLDAVQCFGRIRVDLEQVPAALVSLSAHKFGGPKGIGALHLRPGTPWRPWMHGGSQERGRRGGTPNVPGAAGLAAAIRAARREDLAGQWERLRESFEARVLAVLPDTVIHARGAQRLPNTSFLSFPGIDGECLLVRLDNLGFAVSAGSACTSGRTEPSHVLRAMGVRDDLAHASVRVSIGRGTHGDDLDALVAALEREIPGLRLGRTQRQAP